MPENILPQGVPQGITERASMPDVMPKAPYTGPDPISFGSMVKSAFGNDPAVVAKYLQGKYPEIQVYSHKGSGMVLFGPDDLEINSEQELLEAFDKSLVKEFDEGFFANLLATTPEIIGGGIGASMGAIGSPSLVINPVTGAMIGSALGNTVKQGIGKAIERYF